MIRYYKEEKSILSAGSMKKEVSIVTEGSSIYFGPVLFVLTGSEWSSNFS